jgi:transcription-repair coupling factor
MGNNNQQSGVLSEFLDGKKVFSNIIEKIKKDFLTTALGLGSDLVKAFLSSTLFDQLKLNNAFFITHDEHSLHIWEEQFFWTSNKQVIIPDIGNENEKKRLYAFYDIYTQSPLAQQNIYITPLAWYSIPFPSSNDLNDQKILLQKGEDLSKMKLFDMLREKGYTPAEDEQDLQRGEFRGNGGFVDICVAQDAVIYRIDFFDTTLENITEYNSETQKYDISVDSIDCYPLVFDSLSGNLFDAYQGKNLIISDEITLFDDALADTTLSYMKKYAEQKRGYCLDMTVFPEDTIDFFHERFLSIFPFYSHADLANTLLEYLAEDVEICILTKKSAEVEHLLEHYEIPHVLYKEDSFTKKKRHITVYAAEKSHYIPHSFQNKEKNIVVLTDREIFKDKKYQKQSDEVTEEFIGSLKQGDYVVHTTHGIGKFGGIIHRTINGITREYLHLHYAGDDALYIPIEQADKINKFIGGDHPKLTRLDSSEWKKAREKARKEAERLAGELLNMYAKRSIERIDSFPAIPELQDAFNKTFPYEITPGQRSALIDVNKGLESNKPMDLLICGDVGFGKTEIAMRAAFQVFTHGYQVAIIAPITILAEQHYESFQSRMNQFGVRIGLLSRFQNPKDQKDVIEKMKSGDIDIVIGTHRLLSNDIAFSKLGLLIVDEEQRFGVKQKEKITSLRANINIITLSATPIPRTMNFALSKIRDMSIISTPPIGRLPIITEVRKFSLPLLEQIIQFELDRKGQVYVLHNHVRTIDSLGEKIQNLLPKAKTVVAHGQLSNDELAERISAFKDGKYNILISSTIIENGIDLPNANTMIINNADEFGLSQLYQLRGRVGRRNTQAYSYLLYNKSKLKFDAKKRLRAIVEASELGSGFQIAMRDLEIRGAGDILGSQQSGAMNTVGIGHFLKMLGNAVGDIRAGKDISHNDEDVTIAIELPISAYLPDEYIDASQEKIRLYQKMAGVRALENWKELMKNVENEYGTLPEVVSNLFEILFLKMIAAKAGVTAIKLVNTSQTTKHIAVFLSERTDMMAIVSLVHTFPSWELSADRIKIPFGELGIAWMQTLQKQLVLLLKPEDLKEYKKHFDKK